MKKIIILFLLVIFLSGCATYKFHYGKAPYDKGYVVSRDEYDILEYTIGKTNGVPDLGLAKERFKRRRNIVEHYYKKMGYIENHFKMTFWNPVVFFIKLIGGVFRMPFFVVSDYKYEHNLQYRKKMITRAEEQDAVEERRAKALKEELSAYIQEDLTKEEPITQ